MYNAPSKRKGNFRYRLLATGVIIASVLFIGSHYLSSHKNLSTKQEVPTIKQVTAHTNPCNSNNNGKLLLVSISQQHIWACDNQTLVKQSAVTTGKTEVVNGVDDATPTGSWHITSKATDLHLRGSDANGSWDDPVKYWIPFDGDIGFHDSSWQTFSYGSSQYKTDGSHGCVHLPLDMMAWVYDWSSVGTAVTVTT